MIQLETAVGAAVQSFEKALGLDVPRSRFLPVKTCSDLLLLMSDLYDLDAVKGTLGMSAKRSFPSVPLVKLGSHFRKVKEFLNRFDAIPNLLELDHLTVSGDVTFGKGVALKVCKCLLSSSTPLLLVFCCDSIYPTIYRRACNFFSGNGGGAGLVSV